MKFTLALAFLITAALYASAGFGGGSTYTALLAVSGAPYYIIPIVSLVCNICVVAGNSLRYSKAKILSFARVWPLLGVSVPAAFLGGRLNLSEVVFIGLLCVALFVAGARMAFTRSETETVRGRSQGKPILELLMGGVIGFYSGIVGIGGGIFLAPILYRLRWGTGKEIAAACSLFILMNSMSGLCGQLIKLSWYDFASEILPYWPLVLAVVIGGTAGNMVSLKFLEQRHLRRITGLLILAVAVRLLVKWIGLVRV